MSYLARSQQAEADRRDAEELRRLKADMAKQEAKDIGAEEGRNALLRQIQAAADEEARRNGVVRSMTPYAVAAREGREPEAPSLYDAVTGRLKSAADRFGGYISDKAEGLSSMFGRELEEVEPNPEVRRVAESERRLMEELDNRAAQEAARTAQGYK
ncbi:hypothetical protein AD45P2_00065 [Alteromonas phage vB_AmaP_AD45-P2]|uniref:Uncharacterized protein n=1 Tax=Pseudorhizobium pelagicum TaxID=1509405 RepID=A0A922NYZ7_9HYPH|nr:hypothetical protein [Pseudorhizobium pelagicum]YP_008125985.1 hypothetical protein M610_gp014 [Alteromonas phage vB_AmaP_AD45-P1]AGM46951.1 hypothetical protein AD45P3_00065 [Alteromonas phage vB_AmaP_AD45-P3]AGM47068.1 hypothetical protein AD45P4_00065 [Alteromonas phage vB_AmaP_AD45-P4]AGM47184.1 hypothetical protein AD45P2_00065 [Alteromonas phage vB_AmaP_AD45-P2]AGM46832.1 hypothetical protein AD45P1_00070 [Alteromonas phage vB_AmaP_AD45-P1]KEQ05577.1 hypothetical protein GV68_08585 [